LGVFFFAVLTARFLLAFVPLNNLKKPARGTKASRKRAVKTAKKKTPKKKD
jgi:hypothetical protein